MLAQWMDEHAERTRCPPYAVNGIEGTGPWFALPTNSNCSWNALQNCSCMSWLGCTKANCAWPFLIHVLTILWNHGWPGPIWRREAHLFMLISNVLSIAFTVVLLSPPFHMICVLCMLLFITVNFDDLHWHIYYMSLYDNPSYTYFHLRNYNFDIIIQFFCWWKGQLYNGTFSLYSR